MVLRRLSQVAGILLAISTAVRANPHQLDTISYNFPVSGGGGGAFAQLDKSVNVEIFCIDFANDIFVPHTNYSANLTAITSTGLAAGQTRFGGNTSWATVAIADDPSDGQSNDAADAAIINAANALGRYQMAAYLVSLYNLPAGNSAANDGIQQAIWDILHPTTSAVSLPSIAGASDTGNALELASEWFSNTSSTGRDAFLANYRIVSDATMYSCGTGVSLCGGFQEQITATPEPRYAAMMLIGFLSLCAMCLSKLIATTRVKRMAMHHLARY